MAKTGNVAIEKYWTLTCFFDLTHSIPFLLLFSKSPKSPIHQATQEKLSDIEEE